VRGPCYKALMIDPSDRTFMAAAWKLAKQSFDEGGLPIGSVLVRAGTVIGGGHNQRIQKGDPILHGEMDALRNAGRQATYKDTVLYTTLSPCMMCAGTIVQFKIPRVVIGEDRNFAGNADFLRQRGVETVLLDDPACIELMADYIRRNPAVWNEDIAEN
jgi:cytosine/creatinine deaminase